MKVSSSILPDPATPDSDTVDEDEDNILYDKCFIYPQRGTVLSSSQKITEKSIKYTIYNTQQSTIIIMWTVILSL